MKLSERDFQILIHIIRHCHEVEAALKHFGDNKTDFVNNSVFLNACSVPILQIGELAKHLSDDVINASKDIPWKQIKGMRDFFVHDYQSMDKDVIWETIIHGVPELLEKCRNLLQ